jgi:hypothetical protein
MTVPARSNNPELQKFRSVTSAVFVLKPAIFPIEGTYHVVVKVGNKVINREPFPVFKSANAEKSEINADN